MSMKIYLFILVLIFSLTLILVCAPQDYWLILAYWNEPSLAQSLYYSLGNMFLSEERFYKVFLLVWLPSKYTLLVYAIYRFYLQIKFIKCVWIRGGIYFTVSLCIIVGSIILYLLKVKGCCMI